MSAVMELMSWVLGELPSFFLSEPVSLFLGFGILFAVISLIRAIINLK